MMITNAHSGRIWVLVLLLTAAVTLNGYTDTSKGFFSQVQQVLWTGSEPHQSSGEALARTDLFFGTAKPDGARVTDGEWRTFVDTVITPKFPDGLTVLQGSGQFKDALDRVVQEDTFLLILLYPSQSSKSSSDRIEQIRNAYKETFQQQSVLRLDYASVSASF